jgi:hypothetical protein
MTPIWIFPAYPLLLIAPFAANLIDALPDAAAAARINSVAIAFGAVCIQGTGFLVSLMIYAAFIYRLMTQKLPRETTRPGMVSTLSMAEYTKSHVNSSSSHCRHSSQSLTEVLKQLNDEQFLSLDLLCHASPSTQNSLTSLSSYPLVPPASPSPALCTSETSSPQR